VYWLSIVDSLTPPQWQTSDDPQAMIRGLAGRGSDDERLWDFTIACLRRVFAELPGDEFRRVVRHFEQVGVAGVDDLLGEAGRILAEMKRRARRCSDDAELMRLNAQIGRGAMVFALEFQAPEEAALDVSRRLLEWAPQAAAERHLQAEALRRLFPEAGA
jgi:hypothetical protein